MSLPRTELGKIESIRVGFVGREDMEFGVHFTFSGPGFGVQTSLGFPWCEPGARSGWNADEQLTQLGLVCMQLVKFMQAAKISDIMKLRDVPVELIIKDNTLESWRILTEVL